MGEELRLTKKENLKEKNLCKYRVFLNLMGLLRGFFSKKAFLTNLVWLFIEIFFK